MKRTKILVGWLIQLRILKFPSWAALRTNQIGQAVETGQSGRLWDGDTRASKDDEIAFILGIDNLCGKFDRAVDHRIAVLSWRAKYFTDYLFDGGPNLTGTEFEVIQGRKQVHRHHRGLDKPSASSFVSLDNSKQFGLRPR